MIKEWVYIPIVVYNPVIYNLKLSPSNTYSYIIVYHLNCSFSLFLSILKMTILCRIIKGIKLGK